MLFNVQDEKFEVGGVLSVQKIIFRNKGVVEIRALEINTCV